MKKTVLSILVAVVAMGVTAAAFTAPTADQVTEAAENPSQVGALIKDANQEQAITVLLRIVREIEQADMSAEAKQQAVTDLFASTQDALGEEDSAVVLRDVARRVNPDLLPRVAAPGGPVAGGDMPIALPLAPPVAPEYEGQ